MSRDFALEAKYAEFFRDPFKFDKGRDTVYIRKEDQLIRTIISKVSTCNFHDNGGIGYIRTIKVGRKSSKICDECFAALIRSRILNG